MYAEKALQKLDSMDSNIVQNYLESVKQTFNYIISTIKIKDPSKQLNFDVFKEPHTPESMLILFLYNIEPSFYKDLNDASKSNDISKIKLLGPFARALHCVL